MSNGNITEMREALEAARDLLLPQCNGRTAFAKACVKTVNKIMDALAKPPRNCDMPLFVDGPADNNADKAWLVFKRHNPDAYFDVSGLMRCIDWLVAPATEKEGGAK